MTTLAPCHYYPAPTATRVFAAVVLLFGLGAPAAAQVPIPLPPAQLVEWECPITGSQVTQPVDPMPVALVTDSSGRVWYTTAAVITRLVRLTPPSFSNFATQPATCNWWEFETEENTSGVRLALGGNVAFVRTLLDTQRINTNSFTNNRTKYADALFGLSDLALKGSGSSLRVYTTGFDTAGTSAGLSVLQELNPNSSTNNVRRWELAPGTGSQLLSGVAVHPRDSNLVYVSEGDSTLGDVNTIAEINTGSSTSSVSGTTPNTIRRWDLSAIPPPPPSFLPVRGPRQISIDSYGQIWVVTASGHLVRLQPSKVAANNEAAAFEMPFAPGKDPFALDAEGTVGYTGALDNNVGMMVPFGDGDPLPPVSTPGAPIADTAPTATDTILQFTGPASPMVKLGPLTFQYDNPDATFIETNIAAGVGDCGDPCPVSTQPLGIARNPSKSGTYFYAIGGSFLRVGHVALPGEFAGLVTGGGAVMTGEEYGTFGFVAMRKSIGEPVKGNLVYQNHDSDDKVKSLQITDLTFAGNKATFGGTCASGSDCTTFRAEATDNGAPWNTPRDEFRIYKDPLLDPLGNLLLNLLGLPISPAEGGPLVHGNVMIHQN